MENTLTIAMAGCPNSGKSALFNALTGSRQKVGNYPGVTVERKSGKLRKDIDSNEKDVTLIDLPGIYSLDPQSVDESVSVAILRNSSSNKADHADAILAVIDATNLERGITFVLELKDLKLPMVVALNMIDLAHKRHLKIDIDRLASELGIRVVPSIAVDEASLLPLVSELEKLALESKSTPNSRSGDHTKLKPGHSLPPSEGVQSTSIQKSRGLQGTQETPVNQENGGSQRALIDPFLRRRKLAQAIVHKVVLHPLSPHLWTKRLDRILLNPIFGLPILATILLLMFQAVFSWAEAPMTAIEDGVAFVSKTISAYIPEGLVLSFINDGIIAGVGSVIVFLPQILILFGFIYCLESTGYMMRAAYLMNRLMSLAGLQGQSFVPLLSSFACAIPGMMAARTVKNPKERILTILIAPLMTCSARLPVYVLLISAFIPNKQVLGFFKLQGLVMFSLFLIGVWSAFASAWLLKKTLLKSPKSPFMVEMPTYKWPSPKHLLRNLLMRAKIFLKRAGGYIMIVSMVLWALTTFPRAPEGTNQLSYSIGGRIGALIEPLLRPIGFDSRISIALIPGFAAREVLVSALSTVFAVEGASDQASISNPENNTEDQQQTSEEDQLASKLTLYYGLPTALSLLAWYIYAPQCLATFAVMRRETNSWKWPLIGFTYLLFAAYLAAFVVFNLAKLL